MAEGWKYFDCGYSTANPCQNNRARNMTDSANRLPQNEQSLRLERMVSSSTNSSNIPCKFFLRGICAYGEQCRFLHESPRICESQANEENSGDSTSTLVHFDRPSTSTASGTVGGASLLGPEGRKPYTLTKRETSGDSGIGDEIAENWVNAPEFVPSTGGRVPSVVKQSMSYAEALNANGFGSNEQTTNGEGESDSNKLCPYVEMKGYCEYFPECRYLHGDLCELCGKACLHPTDKEQRKKHNNECIKQHELDMELSFAVARSRDKVCGVCMEIVMEKSPGEQRFGILPNCNHCFCLTCIRKWRQARQFENKIIRACPECRVTSDFVCPSIYWVDTKEEKDKLITEYKGAMSVKNCKYFKAGRGTCPFGNKCFYLHALPDGTKADVGPPPRLRRQNADGDLEVLQQIFLWDYLEDRESRLMVFDDLEDFVAFFSDSEESDWDD